MGERNPYRGGSVERRSVMGWVCTKCNRFYGDGAGMEVTASYCCATSRLCDGCDAEIPSKTCYTHCAACRSKAAIERHAKLERVAWDGKTPLWSDAHEKFFYGNFDDFEDFIAGVAEDGYNLADEFEDARFVICHAIRGDEITTEHICSESFEDDYEPDLSAIQPQLDALNAAVAALPPLGWMPGTVAPIWPAKAVERGRADVSERIDIESCPFCGTGGAVRNGGPGPEWWVSCVKPGCPGTSGTASSREAAITSWNRRARPAPPAPSVHDMKVLLREARDFAARVASDPEYGASTRAERDATALTAKIDTALGGKP